MSDRRASSVSFISLTAYLFSVEILCIAHQRLFVGNAQKRDLHPTEVCCLESSCNYFLLATFQDRCAFKERYVFGKHHRVIKEQTSAAFPCYCTENAAAALNDAFIIGCGGLS